MNKLVARTALLLIVGLLSACASSSNLSSKSQSPSTGCEEKRAAWDLGSGSIKVKAALVNTCELRILKVLLDESQKTNFKEDLDRSKTKEFRSTTQQQARQFITKMKSRLDQMDVEKNVGVATAAFREAKNGQQFLDSIKAEFGIEISLITQQQEGVWGYNAAQTKMQRPGINILVWDIGGGSQQLVTSAATGQLIVTESPWASVSFKNWLLKDLKRKGSSPNPLTRAELERAVTQAEKVGQQLRQDLPEIQNVEVYGIGGVHSSSLANRMKKTVYTTDDLLSVIEQSVGLTDSALKSPYAATEVSNLALVLGLMKGLGFQKVNTLKVTLTDGLLVYGLYP